MKEEKNLINLQKIKLYFFKPDHFNILQKNKNNNFINNKKNINLKFILLKIIKKYINASVFILINIEENII